MQNRDLSNILKTLYQRRQTGLLSAPIILDLTVPQEQQPVVRIWLQQGRMVECDVIQQGERVMYGKGAMLYVQQFPSLNWQFQPQHPDQSPQPSQSQLPPQPQLPPQLSQREQAQMRERTTGMMAAIPRNQNNQNYQNYPGQGATGQFSASREYPPIQTSQTLLPIYPASPSTSGSYPNLPITGNNAPLTGSQFSGASWPQEIHSPANNSGASGPFIENRYQGDQVPQRQNDGYQQSLLQRLNFKQRRVYLLIDGTRTIDEIALLIGNGREDYRRTLTIIAELEQMGTIVVAM